MLLVFHVRLTLLVNMGPRVHFVAVLHDSSVQSGSVEICAVFLRRETKHLRPLSGGYLSGWHSSLVPNDIGITMLQNIYINKLLCPINSPPDCWARHRLLPEHRVRSPSAFIVHVFAQTCNTHSWQTVCLFTYVHFFIFIYFFFYHSFGCSALWQQVDQCAKSWNIQEAEKQFDPWSHSVAAEGQRPLAAVPSCGSVSSSEIKKP